MNKIILSLSALILSLATLVGMFALNLQREQTPKLKGAFEAFFERTSSSTANSAGGTYFHGAVETRTATTVVLTMGGFAEAEKIGVRVIVKNATNSPGTIYVLPEVSADAVVWGPVQLSEITSTGAPVDNIQLGNGSTSLISYTPVSQGTTSAMKTFDTPVIGDGKVSYLRFSMWSTGTSSNLLEGYKLLK